VTGISSAGMGLTFDMLKAGGDIFYKPYKVYQDGRTSPLASPTGSENNPAQLSPGGSTKSIRKAQSMNDLAARGDAEPKQKGRGVAMAAASTHASGKLLGKVASGLMVDLPLAAAEGFRVLPGLYGEKVHEYGKVKDWKTGAVAGAKSFAIGMGEAVTGVVYQPYKGARDGGAAGFAGGLLKGAFGVVGKMAHGKDILSIYEPLLVLFYHSRSLTSYKLKAHSALLPTLAKVLNRAFILRFIRAHGSLLWRLFTWRDTICFGKRELEGSRIAWSSKGLRP
jgi:hypothetical protein